MKNPRSSRSLRRARRSSIALGLLVVLPTVALGACGDDHRESLDDRRAAVAEHGAHVMGFDLERTTHRFERTPSGGVQTVVADDPADTEQIDLIRAHLRAETDRFAGGDFSDPAAIHGHDMPGLDTLSTTDDLTVTYDEVPDGARVTYRSSDPAVIDAVHEWFGAQLQDHGEHAESMP